ncbi:MAG: type II secretion system secretin GspD [Deltaproteobacteria bacterium]|nr:type II secretion system secretin GspD [Deltaproteobacteria bacterium]
MNIKDDSSQDVLKLRGPLYRLKYRAKWAVLFFFLMGCASPGVETKSPDRLPARPEQTTSSGKDSSRASDRASKYPSPDGQVKDYTMGRKKGTEVIIPGEPLMKGGRPQTIKREAPGVDADKVPAGKKMADDVVFNFDNADLVEVINTIGSVLKINVIVDPRVKGTVTIHTYHNLNRKDIFEIFNRILEINGVAAIPDNGVYEIVPVKEAQKKIDYRNVLDRDGRPVPRHELVIQIMPLQYLPAAEAVKLIKPFLSDAGQVYDVGLSNTLLVSDFGPNVKRVLAMVESLDVAVFNRVQFNLYHLENSDVEDLAKQLKDSFPEMDKSKTVILNFIPISRLNSILVISSMPEIFGKVEKLLESLDEVAKRSEQKVFVYRVQNSKAADIISVLREVYASTKGKEDKKAVAKKPETPAAPAARTDTRTSPASTRQSGKTSLAKDAKTKGAPESGNLFLTDEVNVVSDDVTNTILVRAIPKDYRSILETIRELDIYPRQVLIEMLIAEITLSDSLQLGFQWTKFGAQGPGSQIGFTGGADAVGSTATGLVYTINRVNEFTSALRAAAAENKVNILSSPHVIASDNQEAKIDVSKEVPFLSSQSVTTGTVAAQTTRDQTVQYRDTGIILTVTPHINDRGLVKLDINQEVSDVDLTTTIKGIDSPVFSKRVATTTLTVQDGQAVVIGGLIRQQGSRNRTGVPFLSKIPVVGFMFGYRNDQIDKDELLLMITPHVITSADEADVVTEEFRNKVEEVKKRLDTREEKLK